MARAIRRLPGLQDVVIVAVTGFGQERDRQESPDAGFDLHLVKPVSMDALLGALAAGRTVSVES